MKNWRPKNANVSTVNSKQDKKASITFHFFFEQWWIIKVTQETAFFAHETMVIYAIFNMYSVRLTLYTCIEFALIIIIFVFIINQFFDKFTNFSLVCVLRPHHIPTLFLYDNEYLYKKTNETKIGITGFEKKWFENLPKTSWFWFLFSANQCYLINKQMCSVHLIHQSQYIYEIELNIPTDLTQIICSHWRAIRSNFNSYNTIHNE